MNFIKGAVIVIILVTLYKIAGLEWLLDAANDPAQMVPSVDFK